MCVEFGLKAGSSLDLTDGWDFDIKEHREAAKKRIEEERPALVIGSPPCTMFSMLQSMNPVPKWGSEEQKGEYRERMKEAITHLEFCCELYRLQLGSGRHYLHEHPWSAKSWWMQCVGNILKDPRTIVVKTDLCRFGMKTTDDGGSMGPARKRTGFMTSSWAIAEELEGICRGLHEKHNHLMARRAKDAAVYPPELCMAICRGALRQKMADEACVKTSRPLTRKCLMSILAKDVKEGWKDDVHEEDGGQDVIGPNQQDGVSMLKDCMQHMQRLINEGRAWDDVSGMELELKRVKQARQEEMRFFEKRKAYTRCKRDRVAAEEGKLIDVRWIDVNKGDERQP